MEVFTGLSGSIYCPAAQGISVQTIQADVTDPAATDVLITLSGSFGTYHEFGALAPINTDLAFKRDEQIQVTSTGASLVNVIINYIKRGSQEMHMTASPYRVQRHMPGKWHS